MKILYEVFVSSNIEQKFEKYIFDDIEKARAFMRDMWLEVINTDTYKGINLRMRSEDIKRIGGIKTYFSDECALIVWEREEECYSYLKFCIEEVINMMTEQ